ncbi:MAG: hypothetical protein JWL60_1255 [Gemmatimonadetes bacterium]|nr:hypothetical protein [Gemmatimonadota bacterium]
MTEHSPRRQGSSFVEQMGRLWDTEGLPRIAGRIFGFLLIQASPRSLDDLAEGLRVSKASISTDARRLEQLGLLTRESRPGDRRDYYAIADDAPARMLALRLERMQKFEAAFDGVLQRAELHPAADARLQRFERAHNLVLDAMTAVLRTIRTELGTSPQVPATHTGIHLT